MIARRSLLILLTVCCGPLLLPRSATAWQGETEQRVTLVIDYNDGVQKHFTNIAWKKGLTVQDALRQAQQHPRGIRCEFKGEGATALLIRIDDVANQGRGNNWLYRVNGKKGEVSCGIQKLEAGDTILWRFEEYK